MRYRIAVLTLVLSFITTLPFLALPAFATAEAQAANQTIPSELKPPQQDLAQIEENFDGYFDETPYQMPMILNDSVENHMEYFKTRGREVFQKWLDRSARYIPVMKEIFREKNLPEDLVYVAMIESGFNPYAISWARRHRDYLSQATARTFASEAADGLALARQAPRGAILLPAALALSKQALLISILFMVFMAFGQAFSVGTLVAGFAIGYLFLIVSPTPSGIGFVEGAMTLALTTLRVPLAAASIITLAYRGITLWLTLLYGAIAMRWIGRHPASAA